MTEEPGTISQQHDHDQVIQAELDDVISTIERHLRRLVRRDTDWLVIYPDGSTSDQLRTLSPFFVASLLSAIRAELATLHSVCSPS